MNQGSIAILKSLYANEQAPWAAMLLAKLHAFLAKEIPESERAPYAALNQALATWWPDRSRPLHEIYWRELADCWLTYERVPDSPESLERQQQLLTTAYLQFIVLERFERRMQPARPTLPNDLREYGVKEFVEIVEAACASRSPSTVDVVLKWAAEANSLTSAQWPEAVTALGRIAL
jgi:hypothetical protein